MYVIDTKKMNKVVSSYLKPLKQKVMPDDKTLIDQKLDDLMKLTIRDICLENHLNCEFSIDELIERSWELNVELETTRYEDSMNRILYILKHHPKLNFGGVF